MIQVSAASHRIGGKIEISGSKSLSNRYLVLSEVIKEQVELKNLAAAEDTVLLQKALAIIREAQHQQSHEKVTIDIGHAGTDMRFLTSLLSTSPGDWLLTGSERMKQRPIQELVDALKRLGADIQYLEKKGFPPLFIRGKNLLGGEVEMPANVSSQFVSSLLLISPTFKNGLHLKLLGDVVSEPYIKMTLQVLHQSGIFSKTENQYILVEPSSPAYWPSKSVVIESDWSSASYWFSVCALSQKCNIHLSHFTNSSLQADSRLPDIFLPLGVRTEWSGNSIVLSKSPVSVSTFSYDFTECPDLTQTLAVTCFGLGIDAKLTGLSTLRIKETDRIDALKNELQKLGALVETGSDFIRVKGRPNPRLSGDVVVETYNDHRMAMSFAPLCLVAGPLLINNPGVVSKSYPAFWEDLKSVGFSVNLQP